MKKIVLIFLLLGAISFGEDVVDLKMPNSAETIYEKALSLEARYPSIIQVVSLGYSTAGRPIYAVVMSDQVEQTMLYSEGYVEKMHYLVETGIHSRENPGPVLILKMIEDYAKDYENDQVIPDYNVKEMLKKHVIHFIPLSNPDGYNLANRGLYTIEEPFRSNLLSFEDQDFRNYKSNVNGVDLNRNFPNEFYDIKQKRWRDLWRLFTNDFMSYEPSGAYYFGPYAGSEVETNLLMTYLLKYDFRNYVSFHSKGQIVYHYKWMLSDLHNERTKQLAEKVTTLTGYDLGKGSKETTSSGYLTDFTAMNTLKPSITVETIYWKETLPVTTDLIMEAYEEVKYVPLLAVEDGDLTGYFPYKWYKNGQYVRDFEEGVYARAFVKAFGGELQFYRGQPKRFLNPLLNKVTRREMIHEIMAYLDAHDLILTPYLDCDDQLVLKARSLGIIDETAYFYPEQLVTRQEAVSIILKAFPNSSLEILSKHLTVDYKGYKMGRITLGELKGVLALINQVNQGE